MSENDLFNILLPGRQSLWLVKTDRVDEERQRSYRDVLHNCRAAVTKVHK